MLGTDTASSNSMSNSIYVLAKALLTVRASLAFAQWSFHHNKAQPESNINNDKQLLVIDHD